MNNIKNRKTTIRTLAIIAIITGLVSFSNHPNVGYFVAGVGGLLLIATVIWPSDAGHPEES